MLAANEEGLWQDPAVPLFKTLQAQSVLRARGPHHQCRACRRRAALRSRAAAMIFRSFR